MTKKISYYKRILKVLESLYKKHPSDRMGKHLSTALDEYKNLWAISDKDVLKALEDYQASLESTNTLGSDVDIDKIINEGLHIYDVILDERDDDVEEFE